MAENGAEYEPEDGLERAFLQSLVYGTLVVASVVWVVVGVRDHDPVVLSVWVCIGGFAAVMLARLWSDGAPVVDA
jgi:hypothetical protein